MVCPEYLRGVGFSLGRCPIQDQESSGVELMGTSLPQVIQVLGNPSTGSLCKHLGTQGAIILQLGSLRQESIWGRCLEREVAAGPQVCLSPSIMMTPFRPDQSCFLEIMHLAIEPPRRFRPSQWFLWNATSKEAIPKVMKSIQLTAWRLTSLSVPRVASEKKL